MGLNVERKREREMPFAIYLEPITVNNCYNYNRKEYKGPVAQIQCRRKAFLSPFDIHIDILLDKQNKVVSVHAFKHKMDL